MCSEEWSTKGQQRSQRCFLVDGGVRSIFGWWLLRVLLFLFLLFAFSLSLLSIVSLLLLATFRSVFFFGALICPREIFLEAIRGWKNAVEEEYQRMVENDVWTPVPKSEDMGRARGFEQVGSPL
jgi:hypothetical protein